MNIIFDDDINIDRFVIKIMEQAAEYILELETIGYTELIELSLSFVDEDEIREINRLQREIDAPTDVLSFPLFEDMDELVEEMELVIGAGAGLGFNVSLGDVVICTDIAKRQAEEFGHSQTRELVYLFVHSVLHLLGYDHMDEHTNEKQEMRAREEQVMEHIGLTR
ncbi:MAG: rRNA maturation RNase YbeY [Clostridiales Family XIII bacterium]|jgi:probable rRNA maturation factor|nr:rRNA maturation RNase YbeY [Clostridiales Family XIII bacterium]